MSQTQENASASPAKKPYAAPVLRVYGTIQQLTGSKANMGARSDGGPPNMDKTG